MNDQENLEEGLDFDLDSILSEFGSGAQSQEAEDPQKEPEAPEATQESETDLPDLSGFDQSVFKSNLSVFLSGCCHKYELSVQSLGNLRICQCKCSSDHSGKLCVVSAAMCSLCLGIGIFVIGDTQCIQLSDQCQ